LNEIFEEIYLGKFYVFWERFIYMPLFFYTVGAANLSTDRIHTVPRLEFYTVIPFERLFFERLSLYNRKSNRAKTQANFLYFNIKSLFFDGA
jgi:hypothetical protein